MDTSEAMERPTVDYPSALIVENVAFAELFRGADLATPVPSCPEWTLDQLMRHVGRGDRWCAQIVAEQSNENVDPRTVPDGKPPAEPDGRVAWLRDGAQRLLEAVANTGPDTPVWTFLGARPSAWWIRRRLHETAVHRADVALALGVPFEMDPAVGADGITEYLERVVIRAGHSADPPLAVGESLHLHATDPGLGAAGEWTIVGTANGIVFDHGHTKATTALRGPARDLLLAILRRSELADLDVEIIGEPEVWNTWLARTPFEAGTFSPQNIREERRP